MKLRHASGTWIVMALLVSGALATAQSAQWKIYDYPDDGFAASYPSLPDLQRKNIDTPAGALDMRSYVAGAGDTALLIGVCDFGPAFADKDPYQILEGAKKGSLANSGSNLLRERRIVLGKNQGLEFDAENNATHFTARMYLVGTTLYETLVVSPLNKPFNERERFLDSFQLQTRTKQ
jgi:hypothetical protein